MIRSLKPETNLLYYRVQFVCLCRGESILLNKGLTHGCSDTTEEGYVLRARLTFLTSDFENKKLVFSFIEPDIFEKKHRGRHGVRGTAPYFKTLG